MANLADIRLATGKADIEIQNATSTYGYRLSGNVSERRGNSIVGQVAVNSSPTYEGAEPFKKAVWEAFGGGFGELFQDAKTGGTGAGGDPSRFYYADAWTIRSNIALAGMRQFCLENPTTVTKFTPTNSAVPQGVLPCPADYKPVLDFTPTTTINLGLIRILAMVVGPQAATQNFTVKVYQPVGVLKGTIPFTMDPKQYGTWKWAVGSATPFTLSSGTTVRFEVNGAFPVVIGCYVLNGALIPYADGSNLGVSQRSWSDYLKWIIPFSSAGSTIAMGISNTTIVNLSDITQNEFVNNATRTVAALATDNALYLGLIGGSGNRTDKWDFNAASFTAAPVATTPNGVLGPGFAQDGTIYCVDGVTFNRIMKYDGVSTFTEIIAAGKIGIPNANGGYPINNLISYRGLALVFKAEGVYQIADTIKDVTNARVPTIQKVADLSTNLYSNNGTYVVEMNGSLYFNVGSQVCQLTLGASVQDTNIIFLAPVIPYGAYFANNLVTALSTDGQVLYVAVQNFGVVAYTGTGWHVVREYYQINASPQSGMAFMPNPSGPYNYLYLSDFADYYRVPVPSTKLPYYNQIFQSDTNKCGYIITPVWNADQANIQKFINSVTIRAALNGWNAKVVGVAWNQAMNTTDFRTIIATMFAKGLFFDRWLNPVALATANGPNIVTDLLDNSGNIIGGTTKQCPGYFEDANLLNATGMATDYSSSNEVTQPVYAVNMAFIVYFWNPQGTQDFAGSTSTNYTFLDALIVDYLPTLEYVPIYSMTVDIDAFQRGGDLVLSPDDLTASVEFLRQCAASLTPVALSFQDYQGTRTVNGFINNPQFTYDPKTTTKGRQQVLKSVAFEFLAMRRAY